MTHLTARLGTSAGAFFGNDAVIRKTRDQRCDNGRPTGRIDSP